MDQYKQLLAASVLNDGKIVTYRSLSRELKVHHSKAKQMLYGFHQTQNARRQGSCHATYIISGMRNPPAQSSNGVHDDGGDTIMQSSPPTSSMPQAETDRIAEAVPCHTVLIVREEHLEQAKAQFQSISTIFVYSLEPGSLADLNVLSDVSREMFAKHVKEDPLEAWKQYGTIQNSDVRRRTSRRPQVIAAAQHVAAKPKQSEDSAGASKGQSNPVKKEVPVRVSAGAHAGAVSDMTTSKPAVASLKREGSSIMASFGKTKPPKAKKAVEDEKRDETMLDASDEEEEVVPMQSANAPTEPRKGRSEREADLKRMMEADDDEPMEDSVDQLGSHPDASQAEDETEESQPLDKEEPSQKEDENKTFVEVSGGRRRGRRRVMKKRTMKDDEGYLVTREEAVWESFSEDEPAPKKLKAPSVPVKSKGGKGQGSLMNFFGKK